MYNVVGRSDLACHAKIGPPKVGPAGPILAEKFAKIGPPDHFCCQNRSGRTNFASPAKLVPLCHFYSPL